MPSLSESLEYLPGTHVQPLLQRLSFFRFSVFSDSKGTCCSPHDLLQQFIPTSRWIAVRGLHLIGIMYHCIDSQGYGRLWNLTLWFGLSYMSHQPRPPHHYQIGPTQMEAIRPRLEVASVPGAIQHLHFLCFLVPSEVERARKSCVGACHAEPHALYG